MVIKQINSMTEVSAVSWNNLVQNNDPFVCHEFLLALEQSGSISEANGWQSKHLLVFEQQELIAAMPLYLKNHSRGEYVFDQQWADAYYQSGMDYYPKWLNSIPFTPCQGQRILIKKGQDIPAVMKLCVDTIKEYSQQKNISSLHCLFPDYCQIEDLPQDMLIRTGVQFQWFNKNYRDFDDYLQSFTSRQRKNINKERRKVRQQGIQLQRLSGAEVTEQQWQVFYHFYEMTYLKRGQSAYLNIDFFQQLAQTMPEQILLVLANDGKAYVGAALSFIGQDALYGRYWGCYDEYHSLHFEACYYQGLEYCIEHNKQIFDSGAQGEHKISRGFKPINTYSAHWILNPDFAKLIADFLKHEQEMIQGYKQDCMQLLPFKALD
ncbi:GNAT family N-acetyltransferase [Methylococcaceae bacterium HT1]|nr:GNAT family N-acetyltransferase [Methylococcaceae bacterium HT1]TXL18366.1 GNAT family N-acetyltransferase [Methylococcaceae bacterium HT3]